MATIGKRTRAIREKLEEGKLYPVGAVDSDTVVAEGKDMCQ